MEAYYSASFCYSTAFELHRLSDQRSTQIHLYLPESRHGEVVKSTEREKNNEDWLLPLGTIKAEWRLTPLPRYTH